MTHPEGKTAEVALVLSLVVRAMVTDKEAVRVAITHSPAGQLILGVEVAPRDRGKVIGRGGRTARALRIVVQAIAHELGESYQLLVSGFSPEPGEP